MRVPNVFVKGNDALFNLWVRFEVGLPKNKNDIVDAQMDSKYTSLNSSYRPFLEPYFLTVYHILKFIDRSDLHEKIEYARL